jgi:predicted O-methyltransferase YrrM
MSTDPNVQIVRGLLEKATGKRTKSDGAFIADGMAVEELAALYGLALTAAPGPSLEVGMANGTSSVVMCAALSARGCGRLTSIDPFQGADYGNTGVQHVQRAGYASLHELIEEPNYLALPKLVADGRRFGFIFIDGWHSFDYALLDIFYADLLLADGGTLVLHDSDWAAVNKALKFLERHKPYERLSPAVTVGSNGLPGKLARRLRLALSGARTRSEARERRERWRSLSAYRKLRSEITPQGVVARF